MVQLIPDSTYKVNECIFYKAKRCLLTHGVIFGNKKMRSTCKPIATCSYGVDINNFFNSIKTSFQIDPNEEFMANPPSKKDMEEFIYTIAESSMKNQEKESNEQK